MTGLVALEEPRSVGILGGTFNPPHLGHLTIARHARDELELERVLLMPARIPPHKPQAPDPGPEHRLRMCRLLIGEASRLSVCGLEVKRQGQSYTVDTLNGIHASHPDVELTFIAGADIVRTLPSWREPEKLLELADLAVATRSGAARQEVLDSVAPLLDAGPRAEPRAQPPRIRFLRMGEIEVSSSMVRGRVGRGEAIDDLVGAAVAGYIAEQGLYRSHTEPGS